MATDTTSANLRVHPCDHCPPMSPDDFEDRKANIRAHGLLVPIKRLGGELLDGRHRPCACEELGVEPAFEDLPDDTDPAPYVIADNVTRRHLNTSQKAMVAAGVRGWYDNQAKERQREAAARGNKTRHGNDAPVPANLPEPAKGDARDRPATAGDTRKGGAA